MTYDNKINYTRLALSSQGFAVDNRTSDQILETVKLIEKKKGSTSLDDIAELEQKITTKYEIEETEENDNSRN